MDRRRRSTRCVALSDDESSRLLMQAHFANRIISSAVAAEDSKTTASDAIVAAAALKTKARGKPATVFRCPACRRAESVECRIDRNAKTAGASCCACRASYRTRPNALTEPIDVYTAWVDERHRAKELGGVRLDGDGDVMMGDGDVVMRDA